MSADQYEVLDEATSRGSHSYGYTTVVAIAGRRVRAQVLRDSYEQQSFATVHVLADDMTWTLLASSSAHIWIDTTFSPRDPRVNATTALRPIAQRLLDRAATILHGPTGSTVDS